MNLLNIPDLINNFPLTKLSNNYNCKLIEKIKNTFKSYEQQLFLSSFYCYVNYNKYSDYVIDLNNIWKWIGFSSKFNSERILEKHFIKNVDYKVYDDNELLVYNTIEQLKQPDEPRGGHNVKKIFLTINCFKLFCLKAQTKKAYELHNYYVNLENILFELVEEENSDIKMQFEQTKKQLIDANQEKLQAVEEAIIKQFPLNTECIYIGTIDNTNEFNEKLIKFGHTNNLSTRIKDHKKTYCNFALIDAYKVQNKVEIENSIKSNKTIKLKMRSIIINEKTKTELVAYDDTQFTIVMLKKIIEQIIHSKTFCIDNFNKLLRENNELELKCKMFEITANENKQLINDLQLQIINLSEQLNIQKQLIFNYELENKSVYENLLLTNDENTDKFNKFIDEMCILKCDIEESCCNLEGQFRIWNKIKPTKNTFHAFKNYLDVRFKPVRLKNQNYNNVVYGYQGLKLIPIEYKKKYASPLNVETFLFQVCKFSPSGKILNSVLIEEYTKWKQLMNIEITNNEITELKDYLNSCEYVIKSTVWTNDGSNEGYYGIILKSAEFKFKKTSTTGKAIEKVDINSNIILCQWETIAKAAVSENISPSKLSRLVKNNTVINNDYMYRTKLQI